MKRSSNKITDTGNDISVGGRADRYWMINGFHYQNLRSPKFAFSPGTLRKHSNLKEYLTVEFKLKGLEFGNWTTIEHRENYVLSAIMALHDMATVTGLGNNLGFNKLGLSFGARGKGGAALAHFEPLYWVINLTRHERGGEWGFSGGIGSLAHEYGHFLDYYFGTFYNKENAQRSLTGGRVVGYYEPMLVKKKGGMVDLTNQILETIVWEHMESETYTAYYKKLQHKLSPVTQEYWFRRNELFARSFEQYISFKLAKKGIKNAFLSKFKYESFTYLDAALLKKVIPLFDKLLKQLKIASKGKPLT
jgi:hypothetical protein